MKPAAMLGCQIKFGGLAVLICSFVAALAPGHVVCADEASPITVPADAPASDEAPLPAPRDTKATDDDEAHAAPTAQPIAGVQTSPVVLSFKIFSVSKKRAAEAGIDLAAILANKPHNASSRENSNAASANLDTMFSILNSRERELFVKLLSVTGAAKLLAEPTLITEVGRKAKFFSGAEVPSPGPPKNGAVTTESRDVGIKIEVTTSFRDARTIVAELRVDYSEIDRSLEVPPNGFMFPPVRTRSVQTAILMALDETTVLGGSMLDGLLVMVTPELAAPEAEPLQSERTVNYNETDLSALRGQMQDLQSTIESVELAVRELSQRLTGGVSPLALTAPVPTRLPQPAIRTPVASDLAIGESNRADTRAARPAWPAEVSAYRSGLHGGVHVGWEPSSTTDAVYTIRIGSGLYKQLNDGSAIEHVVDGATRGLREFRVVMGPASLQESFADSNANHQVGYGWRRNPDGGLDYFVQVSREYLESLSKGSTLNCTVHPDVEAIDKIYVFMGDAPLPRDAAR